MDDADFDRMVERAANPSLIPGIYNYCDRRCDRCAFADRCFLNLENRCRADENSRADSAESVALMMTRSLERTMEMLRIAADRLGMDLEADGSSGPELMPLEAAAALVDRASHDPLVAKSREYTETVWPITRALRPILDARGDPHVIEALDTIDWFCLSVSSKTFRAVSGLYGDWGDPNDRQSDANGSAKVARLLIADSRRAWLVLMEAGRAAADGVPARLIKLLDDLDRDVAARFPRAMDFVRPGFDSDPVRTPEVAMT